MGKELKRKVAIIFGTRPEAIKLFPVIQALRRNHRLKTIIVFTGQHKQMVASLLGTLRIKPDYELNVMKRNQNLYELSSKMISSLQKVIRAAKPSLVLVQGDTTTAFLGALSAFYSKIPIGHVEAGLRTYDHYQPFPEEINRRIISVLADLHFCPTQNNKRNLISEGVATRKIYVTGNTGIDALCWGTMQNRSLPQNKLKLKNDRFVLVTLHRRESFGTPLRKMLMAIRRLALTHRDTSFVYPVHPNPHVKTMAHRFLTGLPNVTLTKPLDYFDFIHLMKRAYVILTDSGGIQEEAPYLGIPVLILRQKTERREALSSGDAQLIGTNSSKIIKRVSLILEDGKERKKLKAQPRPFGDGKAAERIVKIISSFLHSNLGKHDE